MSASRDVQLRDLDTASFDIYSAGRIGVDLTAGAFSGGSVGIEIGAGASGVTSKALLVSRPTTAQKNALTAVKGMIVYDATLDAFYGFQGGGAGAWTAFGGGSGTVSAATATDVAFYTAATTVGGSSGFLYNSTTKHAALGGAALGVPFFTIGPGASITPAAAQTGVTITITATDSSGVTGYSAAVRSDNSTSGTSGAVTGGVFTATQAGTGTSGNTVTGFQGAAIISGSLANNGATGGLGLFGSAQAGTSGTITNLTGVFSQVVVLAGGLAGHVTNGYAYRATVSLGNAANVYGYAIQNWATTNADNIYGIYCDASIDTANVTNWFIYSLSGSPSSMLGSLAVGSNTAPAFPLVVTGDVNTTTQYRIGGTVALVQTATSVAVGPTASYGVTTNAVAVGFGAITGGNKAVAIGNGASAATASAVAIGDGVTADGTAAVAVAAVAHGNFSCAFGGGTTGAGATASICIGSSATISDPNGVCIGGGASINNSNCVAIGNNAAAGGTGRAIAIGADCVNAVGNSCKIGNLIDDFTVSGTTLNPIRAMSAPAADGDTGLFIVCHTSGAPAVRQVKLAAAVAGQRAMQVAA